MLRAILCVCALVLFSSSLGGCFSFQRKVHFSQRERLPVKFDSAEAAKIYYRMMNSSELRKLYHSDLNFSFLLFFIVWRQDLHETEYHNSLVRIADLNGDGVITTEEANIWLVEGEAAETAEEESGAETE